MEKPRNFWTVYILLALLLVWAFSCVVTSCGVRKEPIELQGVRVELVKNDPIKRVIDGRWVEINFYLYRDAQGVEYRYPFFLGKYGTIQIPK